MNNNCFKENNSQNCILLKSAESIISFVNGLSVANKDTEKYLKSISDNTGDDLSYSFEINNKLDSIKNLLEEIIQNEQ